MARKGSNSSMCLGINFMLLLHNWVGMFVASERTDQVRKLARAVDSGKWLCRVLF